MLLTIAFTGLACGMLLAAGGVAVRAFSRPALAVFRATGAIRWIAGALLLAGALSARCAGHSLHHALPRLLLIAAAIAPPRPGRDQSHPLGYACSLLLSLIPAGAGLYLAVEARVALSASWEVLSLREVVAAASSGIGARAFDGVLTQIIDFKALGRSSENVLPYGSGVFLTLLLGTLSIVNLLHWGKIWTGERIEVHLFSAWMIWNAAQLVRPYHFGLHQSLLAAAYLVFVCAGF